jgi:hypothetical protein
MEGGKKVITQGKSKELLTLQPTNKLLCWKNY